MAKDATNYWCDRTGNDRRCAALCLVEQLKIDRAVMGPLQTYWVDLNGHAALVFRYVEANI